MTALGAPYRHGHGKNIAISGRGKSSRQYKHRRNAGPNPTYLWSPQQGGLHKCVKEECVQFRTSTDAPIEPFNHPPTLPHTVCVRLSVCEWVFTLRCAHTLEAQLCCWRPISLPQLILPPNVCSQSTRCYFKISFFHFQCGCTQQQEITFDKWIKKNILIVYFFAH